MMARYSDRTRDSLAQNKGGQSSFIKRKVFLLTRKDCDLVKMIASKRQKEENIQDENCYTIYVSIRLFIFL